MEPMKKYIDPREATFRPFWTQSHGSTVDSGNYVSPNEALDIKYGHIGRPKNTFTGEVPIWVRNRSILPKIIVPNKTGIDGRSTADMPGAESVTPITNAYTRYSLDKEPAHPDVTEVPVPDVYASGNESRYSSPFAGIKNFFGKIWWAIKLFFIRLFSKVGLYKGIIPINPYVVPEYVPNPETTPTTTPPISSLMPGMTTRPSAGLSTLSQANIGTMQKSSIMSPGGGMTATNYFGSEPFYNHTVIFSQEVLP